MIDQCLAWLVTGDHIEHNTCVHVTLNILTSFTYNLPIILHHMTTGIKLKWIYFVSCLSYFEVLSQDSLHIRSILYLSKEAQILGLWNDWFKAVRGVLLTDHKLNCCTCCVVTDMYRWYWDEKYQTHDHGNIWSSSGQTDRYHLEYWLQAVKSLT